MTTEFKLISLPKPAQAPTPVNQDCVSFVEDLLERVKAGSITNLVIAGTNDAGEVSQGWNADNRGDGKPYFALLGAIVELQRNFQTKVNE